MFGPRYNQPQGPLPSVVDFRRQMELATTKTQSCLDQCSEILANKDIPIEEKEERIVEIFRDLVEGACAPLKSVMRRRATNKHQGMTPILAYARYIAESNLQHADRCDPEGGNQRGGRKGSESPTRALQGRERGRSIRGTRKSAARYEDIRRGSVCRQTVTGTKGDRNDG